MRLETELSAADQKRSFSWCYGRGCWREDSGGCTRERWRAAGLDPSAAASTPSSAERQPEGRTAPLNVGETISGI